MLNKMSAVRIFFTLSAGNIDFKIKFTATHLSVHNILSDKETFLYFDIITHIQAIVKPKTIKNSI